MFFSVLCLLCLCAHLFICALWSHDGKGLTFWLWFVVSNCEVVTFPLRRFFEHQKHRYEKNYNFTLKSLLMNFPIWINTIMM